MKVRFLMFIGVLGWMVASAAQGAGLMDNLVLYLQFEETGDVIKDSSPKGNSGKIVGKVNRVNGKVGKGIEVDATPGNYILIANSPSLNPTDQITIAVWLNLAEGGGNRRILQKGTPGQDNQYRLLLEGGGTFFRFHVATLTPNNRTQTAGLFSLERVASRRGRL